jgi:hydrogenase expression/formation protein HypE
MACEGRMIVVCPAEGAPRALHALRAHPLGREAAHIGTVVPDDRHFVQMRTRLGGRRLVHWLAGDPLPRIC